MTDVVKCDVCGRVYEVETDADWSSTDKNGMMLEQYDLCKNCTSKVSKFIAQLKREAKTNGE